MRQPHGSSSYGDGSHHARECQRLAPLLARGRHPGDKRARLEAATEAVCLLVSQCQHLAPTLFPSRPINGRGLALR
jgi:hypothetical protein